MKSRWYKIISTLFILFTFINCIALLLTQENGLFILDDVFQGLFMLDIFLRFVGLGYENFFKDKWNHVDFWLVTIIFFLTILHSESIPRNSDVIIKMFRIFRITTLIKLFTGDSITSLDDKDSIYARARRLMGQTAIIIPIIMKFSPIFFLVCYYLGVLGMELFHYAEQVNPTAEFGMYAEFSHFKTFLASQYIMVQILTEAGWSMIAFDYSKRTDLYFPTVLYFMLCHTMIVLIMGALIKALIW